MIKLKSESEIKAENIIDYHTFIVYLFLKDQ